MATKNKNKKVRSKPIYKHEKEVDTIMKYIEPRIIDICSKFQRGVYNEATMFAFWLGLGGDLDEALGKIKKPKRMKW
jgi:hypothetical protein